MTQCLSTLKTRMVETLLVMEHLRFAASLKSSLWLDGSGGLPEPAVATAKATAALAELDLMEETQTKKSADKMCLKKVLCTSHSNNDFLTAQINDNCFKYD